MELEPPIYTTDVPRGAIVQTAYVERQVRAYAIFDNEIDSMSRLNIVSTVSFSLASFFASVAISIWVNASFTGTPPPEAVVLTRFGAPFLAIMAAVFVGVGIWAGVARKSVWTSIRSQSKSPSGP